MKALYICCPKNQKELMYHRSIIFQFLMLVSVVCFCVACKQKDKSEYLISQARLAADNKQFQKAQLLLDSIRILYPDDYQKIKKGKLVSYEIELAEQKRNRNYCDSVLKARQASFPEKQKKFSFQQNTAIESIGYYIHNNHIFHGNNTQRCYLQFKTDNYGKYYLTSYYCNTYPIEHSSIRLLAPDGSFCESRVVPVDGALNYHFKDETMYYEMVRFNQQKLNQIMEFIHLHRNEELKVVLVGKNKDYTYTLRKQDLQIIMDGVELSFILSDINRLLEECRLSQAKIQYLKQKIGQKDTAN